MYSVLQGRAMVYGGCFASCEQCRSIIDVSTVVISYNGDFFLHLTEKSSVMLQNRVLWLRIVQWSLLCSKAPLDITASLWRSRSCTLLWWPTRPSALNLWCGFKKWSKNQVCYSAFKIELALDDILTVKVLDDFSLIIQQMDCGDCFVSWVWSPRKMASHWWKNFYSMTHSYGKVICILNWLWSRYWTWRGGDGVKILLDPESKNLSDVFICFRRSVYNISDSIN